MMMAVLELIRWNSWLMLGAGLACTLLALMLGRTALAARRVDRTINKEDPFRDDKATERRASLRRRSREVRVFVSHEQAGVPAVEVLVLDRSNGGLCIALPQEMPVGAVLAVRACDAAETTPWVQAEVRYNRAQANTWEHGCAFVNAPTWGVLLQFG